MKLFLIPNFCQGENYLYHQSELLNNNLLSVFLCYRLHEVGLFTAVKQEGNYQTGQVCHIDDGWIDVKHTLEHERTCLCCVY
jgi:hypothetical protein